jgi:hypothetical protein
MYGVMGHFSCDFACSCRAESVIWGIVLVVSGRVDLKLNSGLLGSYASRRVYGFSFFFAVTKHVNSVVHNNRLNSIHQSVYYSEQYTSMFQSWFTVIKCVHT